MKRGRDVVDFDASNLSRLGILSDSHGIVDTALLKKLSRCDLWIHAGDIGSDAVMQTLAAKPLVAVLGNNDTVSKWPNVAKYGLPEAVRVQLDDEHIIVIHGHQYPKARERHDRLRAEFPGALAVIYGHSHHLVADKTSRPWILNPGASGRSRTFGGPSALIMRRSGSGRWFVDVKKISNL